MANHKAKGEIEELFKHFHTLFPNINFKLETDYDGSALLSVSGGLVISSKQIQNVEVAADAVGEAFNKLTGFNTMRLQNQVDAIKWLIGRCEDQFVRAWLIQERELCERAGGIKP